MKKKNRDVKEGTLLKYKYRVAEKLGKGSFGDVFAAEDLTSSRLVAVKVEKEKKNCRQVLEVETNVMRALQKAPFVVKMIDFGSHGNVSFIVMERLGPDLSVLRKRRKNNRFSLYTTLNLGLKMFKVVQSVNARGIVHRDIKPSNFCIGRGKENEQNVYLIDFSLARRYRYHTGRIRSPRRKVGFRGTSRFASINSHRGLDLYPRDDMWSVWYTMVEMYLGRLPWEGLRDRKQVGIIKTRFHQSEVYKQVPEEFEMIRKYLFSLSFKKLPDYNHIKKLIMILWRKKCFDFSFPLDYQSLGNGDMNMSIFNLRNNDESSSTRTRVTCGSSTLSNRSLGCESVNSDKNESKQSQLDSSGSSVEIRKRAHTLDRSNKNGAELEVHVSGSRDRRNSSAELVRTPPIVLKRKGSTGAKSSLNWNSSSCTGISSRIEMLMDVIDAYQISSPIIKRVKPMETLEKNITNNPRKISFRKNKIHPILVVSEKKEKKNGGEKIEEEIVDYVNYFVEIEEDLKKKIVEDKDYENVKVRKNSKGERKKTITSNTNLVVHPKRRRWMKCNIL